MDLKARINNLSQETNRLKSGNEHTFTLERQVAEYENRFVIFGQEIERLNITLRDYTGKLEEAEVKLRERDRKYEHLEFEKRDI